MRKFWFWFFLVILFLGVAAYVTFPGSILDFRPNPNLFRDISCFVVLGVVLGILGGRAHWLGVARTKLPNKHILWVSTKRDAGKKVVLVAFDIDSYYGTYRPYCFFLLKSEIRIGEKHLQKIEEIPDKFIVVKDNIGGVEGGVTTIYKLFPVDIE